MSKSVKIAISMPDKYFKEIESIRKKKNLSRSKIILEAIECWKESKKMNKLIRIYEDGYKRIPERLSEIKSWEKASLPTFSKGDQL